jgi:hypothetical protein
MGHLVYLCFGFGPVQAQQFSGHVYKEASSLGFREFSCLVENYHVLHHVSSLRGNGAAVFIKYIAVKVVVFIKDY